VQSLFFTFLDGAFRYDCAACGQACCRGKGVAIDAQRDLVPLLRRTPQIASLLSPLPGGYVRLPDVTDGCWFLRRDGMCSYEVAHGRDAKFTTCRLFPFNRVFRVGSLRIVDFNSVVCPLQDALGTGHGVSHAELASELSVVGDGPLVSTPLPLPEGARELRWHVLEQSIVEASREALTASSYLPFAVRQLELTSRQLGLRSGVATESAVESLSRLLSCWGALFGELSEETSLCTRRMAMLTPSLRFNTLFRRAAPAYREGALLQPAQLLAAWFLASKAADAYGAEHAAIQGAPSPQASHTLSLRSLTELYQAQAPLRDLLARVEQPAVLNQPITVEDLPKDLATAAQRLSALLLRPAGKKAGAGEPLSRALQAVAAELPSHARALVPALLLRAGDALRFV